MNKPPEPKRKETPIDEKEYVNECGIVVGGLSVGDLINIVGDLDDRELRKRLVQLLATMYESSQWSVILAYHLVRGKH